MNEESAPERRVFSVREFSNRIDQLFQRVPTLTNVAVRGELSGLNEFGGGHQGFTLKDGDAVLDCIVWSSHRTKMPPLANGAAAIVAGAVRQRPARSGYQLIVETLELVGVGALFLEYERLKQKFRDEGLFESARKRAVPRLPRRIALVSASGKGKEDFVRSLEREAPFVEICFIETRVQGAGAEIDIAEALDGAARKNPDLVVLTRGGGSYEDLFPFNREPVIRAIVRSKIPVVTAIGHTGDHHLADDVADLYLPTPTAAAQFVAAGWKDAGARLATAQRDLGRTVRDLVRRGEQRVDAGLRDLERVALRIASAKRSLLAERVQRLERSNPARVFADLRTRAAALSGRLDTAAARYIARGNATLRERLARFDRAITSDANGRSRRLERAAGALDGLDPLSPLERGYAIVTFAGKALRDAAGVKIGSTVEARLQHGKLGARVESVDQHE